MLGNPERVVAVDANPNQIHLCELKKQARRRLERSAYLAFAGIAPASNRAAVYASLKPDLPAATVQFWNHHTRALERGLLWCGQYEKFMAFFATVVRLLQRPILRRLEGFRSIEQQIGWTTTTRWRTTWRFLLQSLMSPFVAGRVFGDPSFAVDSPRETASYVLDRLDEFFAHHLFRDSFVLKLYTRGRLEPGDPLPVHLQEGAYERIQERLDRLEFRQADILPYLRSAPDRSFDAFSLSDLGSYLDREQLDELLQSVERVARPGATVCLREFLRRPREDCRWPMPLRRNHALEQELQVRDTSVGYTFVCAERIR